MDTLMIVNDSMHINAQINLQANKNSVSNLKYFELKTFRSRNAILGLEHYGINIIWHDGTFLDGVFEGIWINGTFQNGTFDGLLNGIIIGNCSEHSICRIFNNAIPLMDFSKIDFKENVIYPIII